MQYYTMASWMEIMQHWPVKIVLKAAYCIICMLCSSTVKDTSTSISCQEYDKDDFYNLLQVKIAQFLFWSLFFLGSGFWRQHDPSAHILHHCKVKKNACYSVCLLLFHQYLTKKIQGFFLVRRKYFHNIQLFLKKNFHYSTMNRCTQNESSNQGKTVFWRLWLTLVLFGTDPIYCMY